MIYLEAGGRANWGGGREIILKLDLAVYSRVRVGVIGLERKCCYSLEAGSLDWLDNGFTRVLT